MLNNLSKSVIKVTQAPKNPTKENKTNSAKRKVVVKHLSKM